MNGEFYISVDIESAGPIPAKYSMLSVGACVVGEIEKSFYAELKPISKDCVPEALKVSGFDLEALERTGQSPSDAMVAFRKWVIDVSKSRKPVFVGFNGSYDWQFINWYFITFCGENPFGFGGVDIKSYFMGLAGVGWSKSTSSQLPDQYKPDLPQTHNALDDAKAQATIFSKMLAEKHR